MKYSTGFQNTNLCAISQTDTTGVCSFAAQATVLAVHRPFYILICISTLPTQHTTFISVKIIFTMQSTSKSKIYFMYYIFCWRNILPNNMKITSNITILNYFFQIIFLRIKLMKSYP